MKNLRSLLSVFAVPFFLLMAGAAMLAGAPRPNIVLIMADDMGYSDIGCYGGEIDTPNIDGLATTGLRFTQFYNAARCCPTRASLLTGLYPHQAGMGGMVTRAAPEGDKGSYQGYLNSQCATLAEVLREAGYATLMSGKWHVGEHRPQWPLQRGFDQYFGLISGAANYFDPSRTKAKGVKRTMLDGNEPYVTGEGFYMTDAITDRAVDMVRGHGTDDQPFFLYLAYTAPHWPLHAHPEDIARYRGKYLGGWDALREERYERMVKMGLIDEANWPLSDRHPANPAWDSLDDEKKREMDLKMAIYAAQITCMDRGIGKVLATIRELGKEKNTLVLFLSDNGACHESGVFGRDFWKNGVEPGSVDSYFSYGQSWANASNTPLRHFKSYTHEGGALTPFIARWPAHITAGGSFVRGPAHIIDVMPTLCEVAGATYPETLGDRKIAPAEGQSFVGAFSGKILPADRTLYWEHMGKRAVRQGPWKLVSVSKKAAWELYRLDENRTETRNIADRFPEKAAELEKLYAAWSARVGAR